MNRMKFLPILALAALLPLTAPSALAQDADQYSTGSTTLTLDSGLLTALTGLGVTVAPVFPATLASGSAVFPIVTGAIDRDTSLGAIYHSGGLSFSNGTTTVILSQLAVVAEPGGQPTLFGVLTVNNTLSGLYDLFNVAGNVTLPYTANPLVISNLNVTLSSEGASLLNSAFGVTAFTTGEVVGVASISGTTAPFASSGVAHGVRK